VQVAPRRKRSSLRSSMGRLEPYSATASHFPFHCLWLESADFAIFLAVAAVLGETIRHGAFDRLHAVKHTEASPVPGNVNTAWLLRWLHKAHLYIGD